MSKRKQQIILDPNRPPGEGKLFIEVCSGVAGPCLYIGDESGGLRIAGPKPWGGGSTTHRFKIDIKELRDYLNEYEARHVETGS